MPKFLKDKLPREYLGTPSAVYGTLNALGAMKGNKDTPKGKAMQAKQGRAHPHGNLGAYLHPKKSR